MTLRILGKTTDGSVREFSAPLEFRYDADRFIPCDSLDFSVPLQFEGTDFSEVEATLDGKPLFDGIVDRQSMEKSESGRFLKFECRSRAAYLLDNEVKPYVYFQLTSDQLLSRYAIPFGVADAEFPFPGKRGLLQVKKGMSSWQVIEEFCLLVYRAAPYLNRRRILTLNPLNSTVHVLSNSLSGGIRYSSVTISQRNDKLISKLFMKTATEMNGYYYGVTIDNPAAHARNVRRERYYHPQYKVTSEATDESQRIVTESNRDSFGMEAVIPGFLDAQIGDEVRMPEEKLQVRLAVSGVSYRMNANSGLLTRLRLTDRTYA